jgi:hypothetical protein
MNPGISAIGLVCVAALTVSGLAQTVLPVDPTKSVRSGRLILPAGGPVTSFSIHLAEVGPDGLSDETSVLTDSHGVFTFFGRPATKYRVYPGGGYNGIKTPPRIADTADGRDVDAGEMILENCSPWVPQNAAPRAPESIELVGDLQLNQIVIEPQQPLPLNGCQVGRGLHRRGLDYLFHCWPRRVADRARLSTCRNAGPGRRSIGGRNGNRCLRCGLTIF